MRPIALLFALPLAALAQPSPGNPPPAKKPNIIVILSDDVGYGDVSCYGTTSVQTPQVDRLAKEGLRFTSGYCSSATCTPSRFSLLTGKYAFRQAGTGILPGDAALILKPGSATLPAVLRKAGYATGVVGKWHLGLGAGDINWNASIRPCPLDVGFDFSYIMAATGDRVPCVYIDGDRVANLDPADPLRVSYKMPFPGEPDGKTNRASLKMDWSLGHNDAVVNGVGRIGFMTGGKKAVWDDQTMSHVFAGKAVEFIEKSKDKPFFLYFTPHNIHVPRIPHADFAGKSPMGPRGDSILELDWQVGQVLAALDRLGLTENTLVLFSSDNGPVLDDGYKDGAVAKLGAHRPAGPFSGGKYTLLEGGTRVPWIVRWPARVKPGVSDAMISQVDLVATFAALAGAEFDPMSSPDSTNQLPALLGEAKTGRDHIVSHNGRQAIRAGDWKLIPGNPQAGRNAKDATTPRLYDLSQDPGETNNLAADHPDKVEQLRQRLEKIVK